MEVMRQYGYILEHFRTNSQLTNDAIFTMMHHVSGDLAGPESLFVPQILATFSDLWEQVRPSTSSSQVCMLLRVVPCDLAIANSTGGFLIFHDR